MLLTNRGGMTEAAHAKIANFAFKFDEERDAHMKFTEED